jgi:hypothetical protein
MTTDQSLLRYSGKPSALSRGDTTNLADLLERILDKGIVIAGDITISLVDVELLTIKLRLLVASVDKAREMGINWWESDPWLSTGDGPASPSDSALEQRLDRLEAAIERLGLPGSEPGDRKTEGSRR